MDALATRADFSARTSGADADVKSCGPGLPTLRLSSLRLTALAGDGGNKARSPRRARYKR
jgi:hypothetical protein